jgi:hypothetical protein
MAHIISSVKKGYKNLKDNVKSIKKNAGQDHHKHVITLPDNADNFQVMEYNKHYKKLHGVAPPAKFEASPVTTTGKDKFTTILTSNNPTKILPSHSNLEESSTSDTDDILFPKGYKWGVSFLMEGKTFDPHVESNRHLEEPLTKMAEVVTVWIDNTPVNNTEKPKSLTPEEKLFYYNNALKHLTRLVDNLEKENLSNKASLPVTPDEVVPTLQEVDLDALLAELTLQCSPEELAKHGIVDEGTDTIFSKRALSGDIDSLEELMSFLNSRKDLCMVSHDEQEISMSTYSNKAVEDAIYDLTVGELGTNCFN